MNRKTKTHPSIRGTLSLFFLLAATVLTCPLQAAGPLLTGGPAGPGKTGISAQQPVKTIRGRVTDMKGQPLPGVTVMIKGTQTGTITATDGTYTLNGVPAGATLAFSFVGMVTREVTASGKAGINIRMEEKTVGLDEVVAVGYGSQKKASIVGAIQNIEPGELEISSRKNISNTLAGKLAGVIAVTRSGEPGYDQSDFWIRGISSFSGTTSPLVLVDGIQRTLDDLDISEIESFSILKDAAASAMYGVRGANGVILVNTRRGKVQRPVVNFRAEQSVTGPTRLPRFIGAADHMQLLNDLAAEEGKVAFCGRTEAGCCYARTGHESDFFL